MEGRHEEISGSVSSIEQSAGIGTEMPGLLEDGIGPETAKAPADAGKSVCTLENQHIDLT